MKIKTGFKITVIFMAIIVVVIAAFLLRNSNKISESTEQTQFAHELTKGLFELNVVTSDYLSSHMERPKDQWLSKLATLDALIARKKSIVGKDDVILSNIQADIESLKDDFATLVRDLESNPEGSVSSNAPVKRLVRRLLSRLQVIEFNASLLASRSQQKLLDIQSQSKVVIFSIIMVVAASFLMNAFFLRKNILTPIDKLRHGVNIVGSGNLDYNIDMDVKNEIGDLARAFDRMTSDLKNSTVSRDSLLEEMSFRKEAEERIRKLNDQLEQRVKDRTEELSLAKEKAEQASRAKTAFLTTMSHEMRTPLTAIEGFIDILLASQQITSSQLQHLKIIKKNSQSLTGLITDILDIAKIEANTILPVLQRFDFFAFMESLRKTMGLAANQKGLILTTRFATAMPKYIFSDEKLLFRIITNIVGNSIKYTHRGMIGVTVSLQTLQDGKCRMALEVTDTGVGISEEFKEKLFGSFARENFESTDVFGGVGLGLAISRRLAQALGGNVELVSSKKGEGSTFLFHFDPGPIEEIHVQPEGELCIESRSQSSRLAKSVQENSILIVDDSADIQFLLSEILKNMGLSITTAWNGLEAVELIGSKSFDLVFMDIRMPVMDGIMATKRIRQEGYTLPIIALTANVLEEQIQFYLANGFTAYHSKPVNMKSLHSLIRKYLNSDEGTPSNSSTD